MTLPPHGPFGPGYGARPPRPGIVALAPIPFGELFTAVFGSYVKYWRPVLAVSGGLALVSVLLSLPATIASAGPAQLRPEATPEQALRTLLDTFAWLPLQMWVGSLIGTLAVGMLSPVAVSAMLGEPLTPGQVWERCRPQLGRLLPLAVVYSLAASIGLVLLVVPGVVVWTFWAFAAPALVIERCSVPTALRRSWSLVTGQFWRVLGIMVLMSLVVGAALSLVTVPVSIGSVGLVSTGGGDGSVGGGGGGTVMLALIGLVTGALGTPVTALTGVFLYIDARIRRERYDLTLARAAGY